MRLDKITLRGFRNYGEMAMDCCPGVNLIVGDNAQGKTNLLEAIGYLSTFQSFRTRKEAELIGFGKEYAELTGQIRNSQREIELRALLFAGQKRRQLFAALPLSSFARKICRSCGRARRYAAVSSMYLCLSCGRVTALR